MDNLGWNILDNREINRGGKCLVFRSYPIAEYAQKIFWEIDGNQPHILTGNIVILVPLIQQIYPGVFLHVKVVDYFGFSNREYAYFSAIYSLYNPRRKLCRNKVHIAIAIRNIFLLVLQQVFHVYSGWENTQEISRIFIYLWQIIQ